MSASNQLAAFNYAVQPSGNLRIKNVIAAYTVSTSDNNLILNCTGTTSYTVVIPAAATFPVGFNVTIWNSTSTAAMAVTIDPNGAETIDGRTTLILRRGEGVQIVCDGTNWQTGNKKAMRGYAENIIVSAGDAPLASGDGAQALSYSSVASGGASLAFGAGATASGLRSIAVGRVTTASADYGLAIGANSGASGSQAVTGAGAMALGGSYASGTDSFAAAVANNTSSYGATGANSVAIGTFARASTTQGAAFGYNARATSASALALGNNANATGSGSVVLASAGTGWPSAATAGSSIAIGDGAVSNIAGKIAFSSGSSNVNAGISQSGLFILSISTTDATATTLNTYNYGTSNATNQVILPNNSAFAFTGTVVARQQAAGGTASAAWKVEGLIRRGANAGTTTLVASVVTPISNIPLWALALTADTTNGGLAITATGAAATNIRWVATIQTSEVIYA